MINNSQMNMYLTLFIIKDHMNRSNDPVNRQKKNPFFTGCGCSFQSKNYHSYSFNHMKRTKKYYLAKEIYLFFNKNPI